MADTKTTALTAATSWASGDLLYMVRTPAGTPESVKITLDNVLSKIVSAVNSKAIGVTGYSLTGSDATSMIDLAGTWNTSGNPVALKMAITNTASGTTSKFISLLAGAGGATEVFSVDKAGTLTVGGYLSLLAGNNVFFDGPRIGGTNSTSFVATTANGRFQFVSLASMSSSLATNQVGISIDPTNRLIELASNSSISWSLGIEAATTKDLTLLRDAANTLALRNAANAQTFNVYGTWTSASVYERGAVYADSNGFNIAHQQLGATKRPVRILGHDLASAEAVSALEINQTWNTSGNPVGLKMAITNTASGATSKFISLLAGASGTTEVFYVTKSGQAIADEFECPQGGSSRTAAYSRYGIALGNTLPISFYTSTNPTGAVNGTSLILDAAGALALRNAANAQTFNVYGTWTSVSVYERAFMRYSVADSRFEIGTEHTGAAAKPLAFLMNGIVALTIATTGAASWYSDLNFGAGAELIWSTRGKLRWLADGNLRMTDVAGTNFGLLQFGGTTSSFPAIKRSTTLLQARLADDSGYATFQGKIQTHANAVAETPTATHTITIYDAAGTGYKVLCVAV